MNKILVAGNSNYGLAQSISRRIGGDYCSRSTGFDLATLEARKEFATKSLSYDVVILCSALYEFAQVKLLKEVYELWQENKHNGYIISLGSTADSPVKGTSWIYPIEKKSLKAYCKNLSMAVLGGHGHKPNGIKVTYLSPGYIKTERADQKHPEVDKIDPEYLAELIEWLLKQPVHINISEMALDPIQVSEL